MTRDRAQETRAVETRGGEADDALQRLVEEAVRPVPALAPGSDLSAAALTAEVNEQTPALGLRVVRPDSRTHVTGATRYAADLSMPGMNMAVWPRAPLVSIAERKLSAMSCDTPMPTKTTANSSSLSPRSRARCAISVAS